MEVFSRGRFGFDGVDHEADADEMVGVNSIA
jgi:hypothetical protein